MNRNISLCILCVFVSLIQFSCVGIAPTKEVRLIDSLNILSYDYKYKNLDSSYHYALAAFNQSNLYNQGKAEACNNLAFYYFIKMDFEQSERLFLTVNSLTQNELERLIADVGLMKIYQRVAMNKEFYDCRNNAMMRMKRISEDSSIFNDKHEIIRLNYAFTEFYIVSAIYYYYLQQHSEAIASINKIEINKAFKNDINQCLQYHYIKGADGLCEGSSRESIKLCEFDNLYETLTLASQGGYDYFIANGLLSIADLLINTSDFDLIKSKRINAMQSFDLPIDSLLPLRLAEKSLELFKSYGDYYQTAGSYVAISKYLNNHGLYTNALDSLSKALNYVNNHHYNYYNQTTDSLDYLSAFSNNDTLYVERTWIEHEKIKTVPEWILRIREQLSVTYAGLGLKKESDYNRNIYLDILNDTRQDKELENRYSYLEKESNQLSIILFFVIIGMLLVVILFIVLNKRSKIRNRRYIERLQKTLLLCKDITASVPMNLPIIQSKIDDLFGVNKVQLTWDEEKKVHLNELGHTTRDDRALIHILSPYFDWATNYEITNEKLNDERIQFEKQKYIYDQHIIIGKRQNIIKKTCFAIVTGITPYIDRILNEVNKLNSNKSQFNSDIKKEKYQYIDELVTTINEYNDILALWIKMKHGILSLNIETFYLNDLFELIAKGRRTFEAKQQTLNVESTDLWVKADKALTLFMINTLAENARKYTQNGGSVQVSAKLIDGFVEISIEDNGRGLSEEDVLLIRGEKIYNSKEIGMSDNEDNETLLLSKGGGFGLMNCKGIIEKYRKTNPLFKGCIFDVESKLHKGSRFYFRLPVGVKKAVYTLVILLSSTFMFSSCANDKIEKQTVINDSIYQNNDYEQLLNYASDYANDAYFANIDHDYNSALIFTDSAIMMLNEHYDKFATSPSVYMDLYNDSSPAELTWWNDQFETDYHVILDIRNEAAVAFLALKDIEGYNYNNNAYTALYKLQSEDKFIEEYCKQLEKSTVNKTIGIILCVLLLVILFVGYYVLSLRKRIMNRRHLEQVFEINKKILSSSINHSDFNSEALQREEDLLNEIPLKLVEESFDSINDLLNIDSLGLAIHNVNAQNLLFASKPFIPEIPVELKTCFDTQQNQLTKNTLSIPLIVDIGDKHQCVGALYFEFSEASEREADRLLAELIAGYIGIVVYNAIVKIAIHYRNIESAHEETQKASWEDGMLHVQNLVLDNCLSTIKHETIYYPNKIKQLITKLSETNDDKAELDYIVAISELIEYYKGVFTILSSCALRQLDEVTFRRTTINVKELCGYAESYFQKAMRKVSSNIDFVVTPIDKQVLGDIVQLHFLLENLINEALAVQADGTILLEAFDADDDFVSFHFTDSRRQKSTEELNTLFYPKLHYTENNKMGELIGAEYLICKQIIRDHDEFAGRRGCRINAKKAIDGGFTVYFTLPRKINNKLKK